MEKLKVSNRVFEVVIDDYGGWRVDETWEHEDDLCGDDLEAIFDNLMACED